MASRPALAPFDAIRDWERFDAGTEKDSTCETGIFHPGCFWRAQSGNSDEIFVIMRTVLAP
jgi:hypothetical protein